MRTRLSRQCGWRFKSSVMIRRYFIHFMDCLIWRWRHYSHLKVGKYLPANMFYQHRRLTSSFYGLFQKVIISTCLSHQLYYLQKKGEESCHKTFRIIKFVNLGHLNKVTTTLLCTTHVLFKHTTYIIHQCSLVDGYK